MRITAWTLAAAVLLIAGLVLLTFAFTENRQLRHGVGEQIENVGMVAAGQPMGGKRVSREDDPRTRQSRVKKYGLGGLALFAIAGICLLQPLLRSGSTRPGRRRRGRP